MYGSKNEYLYGHEEKGKKKTDIVTIRISGGKKFRQVVVDEIQRFLMWDGALSEAIEGCRQKGEIQINSTLPASDEVTEG